jgi:hypothetical protein
MSPKQSLQASRLKRFMQFSYNVFIDTEVHNGHGEICGRQCVPLLYIDDTTMKDSGLNVIKCPPRFFSC